MFDKIILSISLNSDGYFMRFFLLFIIYSMLGWCVEVICYYIENGKIINRGFLIGPYCPVHAIGCMSCITLLNEFYSLPIKVFIMSVIIVTIIEYITGYILEKLFHARWWDYSDAKFNINGRIKLLNSILFGIAVLITIYILNPFLILILNLIPHSFLYYIFIIFFIMFILDFIISLNIMKSIKDVSVYKLKDNTEEIRKKVRSFLKQMI